MFSIRLRFGSKECSEELNVYCRQVFWTRLISFGHLNPISNPQWFQSSWQWNPWSQKEKQQYLHKVLFYGPDHFGPIRNPQWFQSSWQWNPWSQKEKQQYLHKPVLWTRPFRPHLKPSMVSKFLTMESMVPKGTATISIQSLVLWTRLFRPHQ